MTDPKLKSLVERIERLEEERKEIGGDVRDIYAEAKSAKYNPKALRKIITMRRQKVDAQLDAEVEAYKAALGMAIEMVSNGEVSLRKAAKATGISKSSIHRALAVPAVSRDPETGEIPSGSPAAVVNEGGGHVVPPEITHPGKVEVDDDAPTGAMESGFNAGDGHECGRLTSEPEVARVAPPVITNPDAGPMPAFLVRARA